MAIQERNLDAGIAKQDSGEAWFIVAAAFIAGFVVFGITYCFGVFLEPMAADLRAGRGATSALFSNYRRRLLHARAVHRTYHRDRAFEELARLNAERLE